MIALHPDLGAVGQALASEGVAPLVGLALHGRAGSVVTHRLRLADGAELWLHREAWPTIDRPLHRALAAIDLLEGQQLAVPNGFSILAPGVLPEPAALERLPAHAPGSDAADEPALLRSIGAEMARIREVPTPGWGLAVDEGRFVPTAPTWSDAWFAHAYSQRGALAAAGFGDRPVVQQLWERVQGRVADLETPTWPCVLHRDLGSHAVVVGPDGEVSAVTRWFSAMAGDPRVEVAALLLQDEATAREILAGAGEEALEALSDTAAMEVYAATCALESLRGAVEQLRGAPSAAAAARMEAAWHVAGHVAAPGALSAIIARVTGHGAPQALPEVDAGAALHRRAVVRLRGAPLLLREQAIHALAALSAAPLAAATDGTVRSHYLDTGHRFLDVVEDGRPTAPLPPVSPGWRDRLVGSLAEAYGGGGPALGLTLAAAGLAALDGMDGGDPAAAAGLQAAAFRFMATEAPRSADGMSANLRAVHGVLGLDAMTRLGLPDLAAVYADQVADALDVIGNDAPPSEEFGASTSIEDLLPAFARPRHYRGTVKLILPILAALLRCERAGLLPAAADRVAEACLRW